MKVESSYLGKASNDRLKPYGELIVELIENAAVSAYAALSVIFLIRVFMRA